MMRTDAHQKVNAGHAEGLNATQTKFFCREGDVIETRVMPDHRVRLLFVVLALN